MRGNRIVRLPDEICALTVLNSLDVSNNQVGSTAALGKAGALRSLNLSGNKLSAATGVGAAAPELRTLDVSGNALTTFEGIEPLPKLTSLHAAQNGLPAPTGPATRSRAAENTAAASACMRCVKHHDSQQAFSGAWRATGGCGGVG